MVYPTHVKLNHFEATPIGHPAGGLVHPTPAAPSQGALATACD